MPLYEFQCKQCGNVSEKLCKQNETNHDLVCANCGNQGLQRLISRFSAPGIGGQNKCAVCKGGNCSDCQ